MIKQHPVKNPLQLEMAGELVLEDDLQLQIEALWHEAVIDQPSLFDGPVLAVADLAADRLRLLRISFRHVIAARRSAAVARRLRLRPLAVSGVLICPDGAVFGRRGLEVAQAAGLWELAPSGSVEPGADGGAPDLARQILREAQEELGLLEDQISVGSPLGILEDTKDGLIDVIIPLTTPLAAASIQEAHAIAGSKEYVEVMITSAERMATGTCRLLPESRMIIETWL